MSYQTVHGRVRCPRKQTFDQVRAALGQQIMSTAQLAAAITSYQPPNTYTDLSGLDVAVRNTPDFGTIFSFMVQSVLQFPQLLQQNNFKEGIPLLSANKPSQLPLPQPLVCSMLACQFLLVFPDNQTSVSAALPNKSNFRALLASTDNSSIAKLLMFLNYFRRCAMSLVNVNQVITFRRVVKDKVPDWRQSTVPLRDFHLLSGTIESIATPELVDQIDFANKFVGGGILTTGALQEEIMFCVYPELTVSVLFVERLGDGEALMVQGVTKHSNYMGYAESLTHVHSPETFHIQHPPATIIAIDALKFPTVGGTARSAPQTDDSLALFDENLLGGNIDRELTKAFVGFTASQSEGVATGNWGCGMFRGDRGVKALIQWMAASQAGKAVHFFPVRGVDFPASLNAFVIRARHANLTVGQIYRALAAVRRIPRQDRQPYQDGSSEFFKLVLDIAAKPVAPQSSSHRTSSSQQIKPDHETKRRATTTEIEGQRLVQPHYRTIHVAHTQFVDQFIHMPQ
eukprot:c20301_g1_i4.p1 GENE.c20301_g1_i4~~c20301_g1_i4.p1  ORF type:complete len:513 (+),score=94.55 c20301_g1_i4:46-1584(+)